MIQLTAYEQEGHVVRAPSNATSMFIITLANIAVWGWALSAFHTNAWLLAAAMLAYGFGLHHALNVTSRRMRKRKRFILSGRAASVLFASMGVAAAASLFKAQMPDIALGNCASALFLFAATLASVGILASLHRSFRHIMEGGQMNRRLSGVTLSGILGICAVAGAVGASLWSVMVFPALFIAAASLSGMAGGALMMDASNRAFVNPLRRLRCNVKITSALAGGALCAGGIETLGLMGNHAMLPACFQDGAALPAYFSAIGLGFAASYLIATAWRSLRFKGPATA